MLSILAYNSHKLRLVIYIFKTNFFTRAYTWRQVHFEETEHKTL